MALIGTVVEPITTGGATTAVVELAGADVFGVDGFDES